MATLVNLGKVRLQLAQLLQASPQHHALAFAQRGVARFVPLGFELQRQRTNLLAPV